MEYDAIADWEVNLACNYNCSYCYVRNKLNRAPIKKIPISKVTKAFDSTDKKWLVHLTGGEPFLQPDIIELVAALTKKHFVSINTNLSSDLVYQFGKEIKNSRIAFFHCSLHLTNTNLDVEGFTKRLNFLKSKGFNCYVTQVFHPEVIPKFGYVFDYMIAHGIVVFPKVFKGVFRKARYPEAFKEKERAMFMKFLNLAKSKQRISNSHIDPNFDETILSSRISFKGKLCEAGFRFVYITSKGDVLRCHSEKTALGNIFQGKIQLRDKAEVCKSDICYCQYYGIRFTKRKRLV